MPTKLGNLKRGELFAFPKTKNTAVFRLLTNNDGGRGRVAQAVVVLQFGCKGWELPKVDVAPFWFDTEMDVVRVKAQHNVLFEA